MSHAARRWLYSLVLWPLPDSRKIMLAMRARTHTTKPMKQKAYSSFTAIDGTNFAFADYASFSTWFFSVSRRVMVAAFTAETFRALERAATSSAEARRRMA